MARAGAVVLVASFAVVMVGVVLFFGRNGLDEGPAPSATYHLVERGVIVLAAAAAAAGYALITGGLAGVGMLGAVGAAASAVAIVPLAVTEIASVRNGVEPYALIVSYVVLAFAASALIGFALVGSEALPGAVGWATVVWSVLVPLGLFASTPRDVYFPALHHVMPLVIGLAVLIRGVRVAR